MIHMKELARSMVVMDHHKSAKEACEGLPFCIFDMDRSGAGIVWDYVNDKQMIHWNDIPRDVLRGMHWMAMYVQDRDLWRFRMDNSVEITTAIRSYPFDLKTWDDLARRMQVSPQTMTKEGEAIERYRQILIEQHLRHARDVFVLGHLVPAVECTASDIISDVVGRLAIGKPFAMSWCPTEGGKMLCSFRSDEDGEDVSEIAKVFGGGGHKNSAGCRVNWHEFNGLVRSGVLVRGPEVNE
jgi:oligoribonuclease NrnB/cAMP/cGMP phosphodiesterase (DHH superfamily)